MHVKIASNIISLIVFALIFQVFSGRQLIKFATAKPLFFIIWFLGFVLSILGGLRDFKHGFDAMPKPLMNVLMLLGFASALLFVVMLVTSRKTSLLSFELATRILGVMIIAKWILTRGFNLLK